MNNIFFPSRCLGLVSPDPMLIINSMKQLLGRDGLDVEELRKQLHTWLLLLGESKDDSELLKCRSCWGGLGVQQVADMVREEAENIEKAFLEHRSGDVRLKVKQCLSRGLLALEIVAQKG